MVRVEPTDTVPDIEGKAVLLTVPPLGGGGGGGGGGAAVTVTDVVEVAVSPVPLLPVQYKE